MNKELNELAELASSTIRRNIKVRLWNDAIQDKYYILINSEIAFNGSEIECRVYLQAIITGYKLANDIRVCDKYFDVMESNFAKYGSNTLTLFRCGMFYQAFGDCAEIISDLLALSLRRNNDGVYTCHFEAVKLDFYLPRLIRANYRVCIDENTGKNKN